MKQIVLFYLFLIVASNIYAQLSDINFNDQNNISIDEMLISGPTQLKMHALIQISQNQINEDYNENLIEALTVTSTNSDIAIRTLTAKSVGKLFIQNKKHPNDKAIKILFKLSEDINSEVSLSAIKELCKIKEMHNDLIEKLIRIIEHDRRQIIIDTVKNRISDLPESKKYLEKEIQNKTNINCYEIYKEFYNEEPKQYKKFINLQSSRPRLLIFGPFNSETEYKILELKRRLKKIGINRDIIKSTDSKNTIVILKTFTPFELIEVEKLISDDNSFKIIQSIWLTDEIESQLNK